MFRILTLMAQLEGGKVTQYKMKKKRNNFLTGCNGQRHLCGNGEEEGRVAEMFVH